MTSQFGDTERVVDELEVEELGTTGQGCWVREVELFYEGSVLPSQSAEGSVVRGKPHSAMLQPHEGQEDMLVFY